MPRDFMPAYRFVDGKIAERWAIRDDLGMLRQRGALFNRVATGDLEKQPLMPAARAIMPTGGCTRLCELAAEDAGDHVVVPCTVDVGGRALASLLR